MVVEDTKNFESFKSQIEHIVDTAVCANCFDDYCHMCNRSDRSLKAVNDVFEKYKHLFKEDIKGV